MELTVTNFRGIKTWQGTFQEGLTLLKGDSGKGKSTLLEAVKWCLFANIKQVYPHSGDKKTEVIINLEETVIHRKKNPEELIFTKEGLTSRDSAAQNEIDNIFGSKNLWQSSSYINQGEKILFLSGSQHEKNQLFKEIVFSGQEEKSENYLIFFKERITNLEKESDKFKYMLDNIQLKKENFKKDNDHELSKIKENFKKSKLYKNKELLETKKNNIAEKIKKYNEQEAINILINNDKNSYLEKKEIIKEYPPGLTQQYFLDWKKYLNNQELLSELETKDEVIIEQTLEELIELNIVNRNNKIILDKYNLTASEINKELSYTEEEINKYCNYQNYIEKYQYYNDVNQKIKKYTDYQEQLNTLENSIFRNWKYLLVKLELEYEEYSNDYIVLVNQKLSLFKTKHLNCPECNSKLIISGNKLIFNNKEISPEEVDKLEKIIKNIKQFQKNKQDCKNNLNILKESKLNEPTKHDDPKIKDIDSLQRKKQKLSEYQEISINDITEKIKIFKCRQQADMIKKDNDKIYQKLFDDYTIDGDDYFIKFIEAKNIINRYEKNLTNYKEIDNIDLVKEENLLSRIDEQILIIREQEELSKLSEKLNILNQEYEEERSKYERSQKEIVKCEKIIKIIQNSEHESFNQFISYFNLLVNDILAILFDNCYINVKPFKEDEKNKTIKAKIDFHIFLQGHKYENWHSLSGGEKDRLSLAVTLALNYIRQSPILMLDECMASLDGINREKCLRAIKKYASNKRVINICHETIEGFYNEVIYF